MNKLATLILIAVIGLTTGCATSGGGARTPAAQSAQLTMADFDYLADAVIDSLKRSPATSNPKGERYVLVISRITNATMQRLDTDLIVKKVRIALLNAGLTTTTMALGLNGPEDPMINIVRDEVRGDAEFDQRGVPALGEKQSADISISGKIIQRNVDVSRSNQQAEFYVQLTLTRLDSGLAVWEDEVPLLKLVSRRSAAW